MLYGTQLYKGYAAGGLSDMILCAVRRGSGQERPGCFAPENVEE